MTYSKFDDMFKAYWRPAKVGALPADRRDETEDDSEQETSFDTLSVQNGNKQKSQAQLISQFGMALRYDMEDFTLRKMLSGALSNNSKDIKALVDKLLKNQLKPSELNAIIQRLVQACNGKNPAAESIILEVVHRASGQVLGRFLKAIKGLCHKMGNNHTFDMIYDKSLRQSSEKKPEPSLAESREPGLLEPMPLRPTYAR